MDECADQVEKDVMQKLPKLVSAVSVDLKHAGSDECRAKTEDRTKDVHDALTKLTSAAAPRNTFATLRDVDASM